MDLSEFLRNLLIQPWGGTHSYRLGDPMAPLTLSHCVLPSPLPTFPLFQSVLVQAAHASGWPGGWWEGRQPLAISTLDALCRVMLGYPECVLL